jgi:hypothetical protein
MMVALVLFTMEILATSVVDDSFKYSFFFYLDIISTVSIVNDVPYLSDPLTHLIGGSTATDKLNAAPGAMYTESKTAGKIT